MCARIRVFLNPQLFLSGFKNFHVHTHPYSNGICPSTRIRRKLAHRIPNAHDYQEMLRTERNLSISSGKQTRERAAKSWGAEERQALSFFPCNLLSRLLWVPLARYFSWRACSQDVTVFIAVRDGCINIIMAHSILSVLYPCPQTLGSRHLRKLLKLSSVAYHVNFNHFCKIYLQL